VKLEKVSGLPVIGAIGEVVTAAQESLRARRLKQFAGGAAGLAAAWVLLVGLEMVQRGSVA
jgi:hypothetical protein